MSLTSRSRLINPRLGTYFSIFAAIFAAIFLLSLIFEELAFADPLMRWALFAGPIVLYAAIGWSVMSAEPLDFFAAGRRVPPGYTGALLAVIACGGTLLVSGAGAFFFSGFDALVLMMGGLSGFILMATLLAPFYRKFGAFTVPSYLGRRFDSRAMRLTSAAVASVPILLVMAAELRIGASIAAALTGLDTAIATLSLAAAVALVIVPGGKRSFTWAGVAQSVAAILALAIVAATIATLVTSLPVPQLTHGPLVRNLVRNEAVNGLQMVYTSAFGFDLPREGLAVLTKPYTMPFGSVGAGAFILAVVTIATGIAAAPWLLPRTAATPSVYAARKSIGWATVLFGVILLTVSSMAVFMRDYVLDAVMAGFVGGLPGWLDELVALGYARAPAAGADPLSYAGLAFDRDSVLFSVSIAAGLPRSYVFLLQAGALGAALVAISATTMALAAILSEDVTHGTSWEPRPPASRVWITRLFICVAAAAGAVLTLVAPTDPLQLVLWALSLTSASLFPLLVLSIWWKRLTRAGAAAALIGGFVVAALAIFLAGAGILGLPSAIAGILGMPAGAALAMVVSSLFPDASRHDLEIVRDIRVPGGEIIYDREMRRLLIKKQTRD